MAELDLTPCTPNISEPLPNIIDSAFSDSVFVASGGVQIVLPENHIGSGIIGLSALALGVVAARRGNPVKRVVAGVGAGILGILAANTAMHERIGINIKRLRDI